MTQALLQHLLVAWRSGLRSRSFQALAILGFLAMGAAYLAAEFSGRQPATVALDVGLSALRIIGLLLILFWCQEFVGKEIERRTVFFALAYPAPRSSYLVGRYLGLILLGALAIAGLGVLLMGTVYFAAGGYVQASPINLGAAYLLTLAYILLDMAVVAAFGIMVSAISTTPFLPLALGLAFAIAARSLGPALDFLLSGSSTAKELQGAFLPVLHTIRWLLPDLSRLDIRPATLYGQWPSDAYLSGSTIMALAYIGIMLSLAVWAFSRRQFN